MTVAISSGYTAVKYTGVASASSICFRSVQLRHGEWSDEFCTLHNTRSNQSEVTRVLRQHIDADTGGSHGVTRQAMQFAQAAVLSVKHGPLYASWNEPSSGSLIYAWVNVRVLRRTARRCDGVEC